MITGIDWYEHQIREKKKQLAKHRALLEIYKDKDAGVDLEQMIYDDEHYIMILQFSMENAMWYKERADIGWCADK